MNKVVIFLLLITISSCGDYCLDYLYPKEFDGIITSKYRDSNDHNFKKVVITHDNVKVILVIEEKNTALWNFIEEGYSISKKENSTEIKVIRNKEEYLFDLCN